MKDSIGNAWLLGLVLVFILLFSAYIAVTVDYSQTFKLKNTVLTIIEKNKGITNTVGTNGTGKVSGQTVMTNVGTLQTINLYLNGNAYTAKGACPDDGASWVGVSDLNYGSTVSLDQNPVGDDYYYCLSAYKTGQSDLKFQSSSGLGTLYFKVRLFYKMEFPVISEFLSVKVEGITDEIYKPYIYDTSAIPINSEYYASA